jgi:hypothetical protein
MLALRWGELPLPMRAGLEGSGRVQRVSGRNERLLTALNNRCLRCSLHGRSKKGRRGMDENRRAVRRRRVLKSATIEFDRGAYSCAVRNLSEAGAALDVPYARPIPHEFTLVMESDQARWHCRVIWRKEGRLGVAFEQTPLQ